MQSAASGPRWLYLHSFGSSPSSTKARALAAHYAERGVDLERLDLRRPSLEHLRLGAMLEHVSACIGTERDRAILIGSSLGGLAAARMAERDARVCALVLLAPAFGLARRWRERLGAAGIEAWRKSGWIGVRDHVTGSPARLHYGFMEEVERMDAQDAGVPEVRIPTLIVHGVHDEAVSIDFSRAFARGKRHVRVVDVDDGHALLQSLDRVTVEMDAFLRGRFL
jgi:pimeloyl-ACP methyl ester carboxylesterase